MGSKKGCEQSAQHGVAFANAAIALEDEMALTIADDSADEKR
jgi:uncharacterized DUF497 family protein